MGDTRIYRINKKQKENQYKKHIETTNQT